MVQEFYGRVRPHFRRSEKQFQFRPSLASERIPVIPDAVTKESLQDFKSAFESVAPSVSEFFYQLHDGTWLSPDRFEEPYVIGRIDGVDNYVRAITHFRPGQIADTVYFRNFVMVGGISIRSCYLADKQLAGFFDERSWRKIAESVFLDDEFHTFVHCIGDFDLAEVKRRYKPDYFDRTTTLVADGVRDGNPVDMALMYKNEPAVWFFFEKGHIVNHFTPSGMHAISHAANFVSDRLLKLLMTAKEHESELWQDILLRVARTPRIGLTRWIFEEHDGVRILGEFDQASKIELATCVPVVIHRLLHDYGFDTHKIDFGDVCPIHSAVEARDFDSANWFLERGFSPFRKVEGLLKVESAYDAAKAICSEHENIPYLAHQADTFIRNCDNSRER